MKRSPGGHLSTLPYAVPTRLFSGQQGPDACGCVFGAQFTLSLSMR